jgi:radical SAM protein with 4Fe4S-binding SPASM domain
MDRQIFYKNRDIYWRWENDKEIIACFNDKYWRFNETASLIFYYCKGINLTQIINYFEQFYFFDKKCFFPAIRQILDMLLKEKIIFSRSRYDNITRNNPNTPILNKKNLKFVKPEIRIFDIRTMDHLNFDRPESPLRIFFTINHDCNLKCMSCYNPIKKNKNYNFDLNKVKNIIDKIKNTGVFEIILTGGEPFLNLNIFEIIDYILSKNIKLRINTNGILLTDEFIRELKKKKNITLTLGLDGISEKANDLIRGEGHFKRAVKILERLSKENINLYVNFTATHKNFSDVLKLKRFFRNFNVARVIVNVFIRTGTGYGYGYELALNKLEFSFLKLLNFFNNTASKPIITTITSCYAGHIEACIDYEGKIFFCELLDYPLGNILEKNIREIWNSPEMLSLIDVDKFKFPCGSCFFRKTCRGSCRAEVFYATGNIYSGNPYCFKGKIMQKFFKNFN